MLEHAIRGKGKELAFSPVTEILLYRGKGLQLVGPLPAEVQKFTAYAAEPAPRSKIALAFVRFLGTPAAKAIFVAAGIDPGPQPKSSMVKGRSPSMYCNIAAIFWLTS